MPAVLTSSDSINFSLASIESASAIVGTCVGIRIGPSYAEARKIKDATHRKVETLEAIVPADFALLGQRVNQVRRETPAHTDARVQFWTVPIAKCRRVSESER